MKKLTAILLLLLFIFNTVGYRLFISYLQNKADVTLTARLDDGRYNSKDLFIVKVPINLPYQTNWKEFERVDGEINYNGKVFKYVKRKLFNDTMILVCIQNGAKEKLVQQANDYLGKINDFSHNSSGKKCDIAKQLNCDFDGWVTSDTVVTNIVRPCFNFYRNAAIQQQCLPLYGQPPQSLA